MKTIAILLFFSLGVALPNLSHAELVSCGVHSIQTLYIQGDRDDNNAHGSTVIAQIDGAACNGYNLIYIEKSSAHYDALLSGLMAAYVSNMRIGIYVNSSSTIPGATQIAIINLLR